MTYLIDTDYVVDFLVGQEMTRALFRRIRPLGASISLITFMEIYEGIEGGRDSERAEQTFRAFLNGTPVLGLNRTVARRAAHIRATLRSERRPITHRALDILIAATAVTHGLTLVTRNVRDYRDIPDLQLYEPS